MRGSDTSKGKFGRGALETDEVEREIVDLGLTFLLVGEGVDTVEHGGYFHENLGILDEILPLGGVQLLEVLQGRNGGFWSSLRLTDRRV